MFNLLRRPKAVQYCSHFAILIDPKGISDSRNYWRNSVLRRKWDLMTSLRTSLLETMKTVRSVRPPDRSLSLINHVRAYHILQPGYNLEDFSILNNLVGTLRPVVNCWGWRCFMRKAMSVRLSLFSQFAVRQLSFLFFPFSSLSYVILFIEVIIV